MDAPSFDAIYRELRGPVSRLCLNVTGNRAQAEDAVQDTFLAVHRHLGEFRGESRVSTWVYRIALRAALRARGRRLERATEEPEAALDPEPSLQAREEVRRLGRAMDRLSAEQRVTLSLFALEDLGHKEIAELLGVPEGTVWSRLHLARKRLSEELARGGAAGAGGNERSAPAVLDKPEHR